MFDRCLLICGEYSGDGLAPIGRLHSAWSDLTNASLDGDILVPKLRTLGDESAHHGDAFVVLDDL